MISTLVQAVQAAIAAYAASPGYSLALTATMDYLTVEDLAAMQGIHVFVLPSSVSEELESRHAEATVYSVDVVVSKHLDNADRTLQAWRDEISALLALVEQIAAGLRFGTMAGCTWMSASISPLYDPRRLKELNVFCSVLRLTYWNVA